MDTNHEMIIKFTFAVKQMEDFLRHQEHLKELKEIYFQAYRIHSALFNEGQPLPNKWQDIYHFIWRLCRLYLALQADPNFKKEDFEEDFEEALRKIKEVLYYLPPEPPSMPRKQQ